MFGASDDLEEYSVISDHELDQIYKAITSADTNATNACFLTPNRCRRRFIGALRSRGLGVQRWRVSNCLRRLDPVGTALRWRLVILQCSHTKITVALRLGPQANQMETRSPQHTNKLQMKWDSMVLTLMNQSQ